jgi:hypothetical protein
MVKRHALSGPAPDGEGRLDPVGLKNVRSTSDENIYFNSELAIFTL